MPKKKPQILKSATTEGSRSQRLLLSTRVPSVSVNRRRRKYHFTKNFARVWCLLSKNTVLAKHEIFDLNHMYLDPFSLCKNKTLVSLKLQIVWFVSLRNAIR